MKSTLVRPCAAVLLNVIALVSLPLIAQSPLSLSTNAVGPERFMAAHGQKAIAMGYATAGLEMWAYPLQLIRGYQPGFQVAGSTSEIPGSTLLRRVSYEAEAIVRTYIGPDFVVKERIFVPLVEPAIFITYTVESQQTVDVVVHFTPVLDLMWPAALGGQSARWDGTASVYTLSEGRGQYGAWIGSQEVVAHDQPMNSAEPAAPGRLLAFTVRAGSKLSRSATVVVSRSDANSAPPAERLKELLQSQDRLEKASQKHYADLLAANIHIETPDPAVNQQLAWAQIALDQAFVFNPVLGCGLVAGYGPSREARRPQYAWFFAGDGLIAIDALVESGAYDRARAALAFIAKYQDAATGMVWHEISQSADPVDWATKYPYMFVHVDITFDYLIAVEHYVAVSGDKAFLQQNWKGIAAAYRYSQGLLNAEDGLPRIPSTKEGGDEQDKMTDDPGLAASWVAASAAFAKLAQQGGHADNAQQPLQASEKARVSAGRRYWDEQRHRWIDGYTEAGRAIFRQSTGGLGLVSRGVLDAQRSDLVLDQLASADFQTDWGSRGLAASSSEYDPAGYAKGSVSAAGTAGVANAFWAGHRPATAWGMWSALMPWGTLDSLGHMHELLTGDFYHQQTESVPEQTWSSAAFVSATVRGLLGLERDAQANRLIFAPHLPAGWDQVLVEHVPMRAGTVAFTVRRVNDGLSLDVRNGAAPFDMTFSPEIPLGARLVGATLNGRAVRVRSEANAQDQHASLQLSLPGGESRCLIRYTGGVSVEATQVTPMEGDASHGAKITGVRFTAGKLMVSADVFGSDRLILRTGEKPVRVQGAKIVPVSDGVYGLDIESDPDNYRQVEVVVELDSAGK